MQRIKFSKPTQVEGKNYAAGSEGDFAEIMAAEIVALSAGEILGPSSEYHAADDLADDAPRKRTRQKKAAT